MVFAPRITVASLSDESGATWAGTVAPHADVAFLGGVILDKPAQAATHNLVAHGCSESLTDDPIGFTIVQLDSLDGLGGEDQFVAVNARATSSDPIQAVTAVCVDHDTDVEINAHYWRDELYVVSCGKTLLRGSDQLTACVTAAAKLGASVGAKVHAEIDGVDHPNLAVTLTDAGTDWLHVGMMGPGAMIADVTTATPDLFLIANNGVRGCETATEYLDYGADAVSVGRPNDNPRVLRRV